MSDERQLFLLGQKLYRLKPDVPPDERKRQVCDAGFEEKAWEAESRVTTDPEGPVGIVDCALSTEPLNRVALVCDAGLGKSTNMRWLQAQLSRAGSKVVPLLIPLDEPTGRILLKRERASGGALAKQLARWIKDATKERLRACRRAVERKQTAGQIVLLIDGLDHAIDNPETATMLRELIECAEWRGCPVWISGRPEAFKAARETVFKGPEWQFLRIVGLARAEVRFYLAQVAGADLYEHIPDESAHLFAIPRLLHLISGIIRRDLPPNADAAAQIQTLKKAKLNTAADVYRLAYFHPGCYDDFNSRGLLGQGLKDGAGGTKSIPIGLEPGEVPDRENYETRLRRTAQLLGAIAFQMHATPANPDRPQPNIEGVAGADLKAFKDKVADRLVAAGLEREEFYRDFRYLTKMNISTVEYLFFRQSDKKGLAWHDRTVQAFFAAYWTMNYATKEELKAMDRWKVVRGEKLHPKDEDTLLVGFDEFWQFAAEMPDRLFHDGNCENWFDAFERSYAPPAKLQDYDEEMMQWHRRMIYHSYARMEELAPETIQAWQDLWLKLEQAKGTERQRAIVNSIHFCRCPRDPAEDGEPFWMGSPPEDKERFDDERYREERVKPFAMQDFPVTNAQYELFDPKHSGKRNEYSRGDEQPVIHVSFWDAWCYAKWTGHRLPTEVEWEYACRAGTSTRYHFGDWIDVALCNYGRYVLRTTTKGERNYPANAWGLANMHGNVWEWCDSRLEPGGSDRALRGGDWHFSPRYCQSASRERSVPTHRNSRFGFRPAFSVQL